jgi:hypothetical protein
MRRLSFLKETSQAIFKQYGVYSMNCMSSEIDQSLQKEKISNIRRQVRDMKY